MDYIRPTPRNPIYGLLADQLEKLYSPTQTQQMQGLMRLLMVPEVSKTMNLLAYGEPLTTGAGGIGGTTMIKPEVLDAAMAVAPMAPVAGRAARGAARMAGQEITDVMSGMPSRSLLGDITPKPMMLDVWHGTPHTLPPVKSNPLGEFDAAKIGTGEGAQAYGHGIYVAESPIVGKEYQRKLGNVSVMLGDTSIDDIIAKGGDAARAAERLKKDFTNTSIAQHPDDVNSPAFWKETENYYKTVNNQETQGVKKLLDTYGSISASLKGNLYKADLPDEMIPKMLDWDRPLSEQKAVMSALRAEAEQKVRARMLADIENDIRSKLPKGDDVSSDYMSLFNNANIVKNQEITDQAMAKLDSIDLKPLVDKEIKSFIPPDRTWEMTGEEYYKMLTNQLGSPKQASEMFANQGIPGIKYLDERSRGSTGQGKWKVTFGNGEEKIMNFKPNDDAMQSIGAKVEPYGTSNFVVFPGEEQKIKILQRNSENAMVDPMRRNESDILAGLLPASLLADPETRRKLDEELSLLYTK